MECVHAAQWPRPRFPFDQGGRRSKSDPRGGKRHDDQIHRRIDDDTEEETARDRRMRHDRDPGDSLINGGGEGQDEQLQEPSSTTLAPPELT